MSVTDDQLLEAHAPGDFLSRVSALHQGEVARLEGGVAVKRLSTEDGRDGFRVARAPSWRTDTSDFSYGDFYRTAEEAVRAAFRASAESTDPESIGGQLRIARYGPYEVGGREVGVVDWTTDGKAVVRLPDGTTLTVEPGSLQRKVPQLLAAEDAPLGPLREDVTDRHGNRHDRKGKFTEKSGGAASAAASAAAGASTGRDTSGREIPRGGIRALDDELVKIRALGPRGGDYPKDPEVIKAHLRELSAASLERLNKRVDKILQGHRRHDERMHQQNRRYQPSLGYVAPDGYMTKELKRVRNAISSVLIEKYHGRRVQEREVGKPGTNWTQVAPENRKKIDPIVRHYMKDPHPFAACKRDGLKHGWSEEKANRICAVVKDMGERRTTWRKGGKKLSEDEAVAWFRDRLIEAADGDVDAVEVFMLATIAEREHERALRGG